MLQRVTSSLRNNVVMEGIDGALRPCEFCYTESRERACCRWTGEHLELGMPPYSLASQAATFVKYLAVLQKHHDLDVLSGDSHHDSIAINHRRLLSPDRRSNAPISRGYSNRGAHTACQATGSVRTIPKRSYPFLTKNLPKQQL